ncbi:MAG TPA: 4Fe-4S binding protein [Ignavibacteriales bacterium]|nr:4Fe-4S binding protein [Ignavibacteriales bacterium]
MLRKIIKIDEDKCDGCGDCTHGCAEGAIKLVNGKAKLVKESYCDGLGACIAFCPQGAIEVIDREADDYSEADTLEYLFTEGEEEVRKHLLHLLEHNQVEMLASALTYLAEKKYLNFDISTLLKEKELTANQGKHYTISYTDNKTHIAGDTIQVKKIEPAN